MTKTLLVFARGHGFVLLQLLSRGILDGLQIDRELPQVTAEDVRQTNNQVLVCFTEGLIVIQD